ncbi:SgcJ/EcaC family oxidoreductase, partial [Fulvivirgaceae bacterium PWU4]
QLKHSFASNKTASDVWKVREVRFLAADIALLRAVVGMVPPGGNAINPATNAIQSLVALRQNNVWKIALFQNTPAQFHGRPELVESMTKELSALL